MSVAAKPSELLTSLASCQSYRWRLCYPSDASKLLSVVVSLESYGGLLGGGVGGGEWSGEWGFDVLPGGGGGRVRRGEGHGDGKREANLDRFCLHIEKFSTFVR